MLKALLSLGKASIAYLVAFALPSFLGVILLPLYTRFLTPYDYGITAVCASVTGFVGAFSQLGLLTAYSRKFVLYRNDGHEMDRYTSTIMFFLCCYGLVATTLAAALGGTVAGALVPDVPFSPHIQVALWAAYFNLASALVLTIFRSQMRPTAYLVFSAGHVLLTTALTIALVVVYRQGALGYLTAGLMSNAAFGLVALFLLRGHWVPHFSWAMLWSSLRFGLPLVPETIGAWMFSVADRIMLSTLVNTSQAGLYSLGFQIANLVGLVSTAMNFAWRPYFFTELSDHGDEAKTRLARLATYWMLAMCVVCLLASGFAREIVGLLTPLPYHTSYTVVPIVAIGLLFGGIYYIFVNSLYWLGKTVQVATATVVSGALNVGLNLLLLPRMQMLGAALATALANLFLLLVVAAIAVRVFPFPYEYRRMTKLIGAFALSQVLLLLAGRVGDYPVQLVAKIMAVGSFPVALLFVLRFPTAVEAQYLRRLAALDWLHHRRRDC